MVQPRHTSYLGAVVLVMSGWAGLVCEYKLSLLTYRKLGVDLRGGSGGGCGGQLPYPLYDTVD